MVHRQIHEHGILEICLCRSERRKSEYNVDLTICGPETEEDYEEQNRLIDEAVAAGADAIVYSAISYTKNAEAITARPSRA